MKNITTLILFCLLLPRGVCGQGISISNNFRSDHSFNYDDWYKPSGQYSLYSASVYTKNKVRKVELFHGRNYMPFMLMFDKQGRIIKSKNCGSGKHYTIITDSIFEFGKTTVIDSFFYRNELTRIDTLIINKVEIRRRNNKTISYDKAIYKSYKSGAYINDRIEKYKQIRKGKDAYIIRRIIIYIDHGYYTPPRRVDGNVDGILRFNYRKRAAPATTPILRIRPYLPKKFYLAQKKTFYINNTDKTGYLSLRDKRRCFVEGEDDPGVFYEFGPQYPRCGGSRHYPPPIEEEKMVYNNKNLLDTVFRLTYYEQAKDKPCVKPKDSLFTDYLRGYSGEPQKGIEYYFRYEYFDE